MGFCASDTTIRMTRGDTAKFNVTIRNKNTGEPYEPVEGEIVRFSLKKYLTDPAPMLVKDIPIDTMILKIKPEDTKSFPFGIYHYDMELIHRNGDTDTFIEDSIFELTREVG